MIHTVLAAKVVSDHFPWEYFTGSNGAKFVHALQRIGLRRKTGFLF